MSKPLTFGEIKVGDHFIAFPRDGDDSGHGGYRKGAYLFKKTADTNTDGIHLNGTAVRLKYGNESTMPLSMEVYLVLL